MASGLTGTRLINAEPFATLSPISGKSNNFRKLSGGCAQDRTVDPLIKSQLLYQLSYTPTPARQRLMGRI